MENNLNNEVRIRVKSASHRCEDIEISCPLMSTVKNVKQIIKDQYPLHPEITEQRIIYAGHLLEDDQVLSEVFAQGGQVSVSGGYTFHLACNSTFLRKASRAMDKENRPSEQTKSHEEESVGSQPQTASQGVTGPGIPQDILALHQVYVEQMMAFMNQWNQGVGVAPVWMPGPGPEVAQGMSSDQLQRQVPIPQQQNQVLPEVGLNEQRVIQNEPIPAPQAPLPRVPDEDEAPRDVLDWIYTMSRLFLILSVVYFYSNFARFLLVLLFTALIMFAQRRPGLFNGFRGLGQAQPNPPNQAPVPPIQQQAEQQGNTEAPANPVEPEATESGAGAPSPAEELPVEAQAQQQQRLHPFDITRTFLMTFFTSLIPEMNPN